MRHRPDRGISLVYGGPSMPRQPKQGIVKKLEELALKKTPPDLIMGPPPPSSPSFEPEIEDNEREKVHLRVTSRVGEDGQLRLKIYVDGVLLSESIAEGSTVTVETEV